MEEEWRDVPEWEGFYQASNLGRVKSLDRLDTVGRRMRSAVMKQHIGNHGYPTVMLSNGALKKRYKVHQLIAMAFLKHIPCGFDRVVNHINFNKTDNRVENLEVVSTRENINHKKNHGTSVYPGVYWRRDERKYQAAITHNKKSIYLGLYIKEEDAGEAYQKALKQIENGEEVTKKHFKRKRVSIYEGVYPCDNKWCAYVRINKKRKYVGSFNTEKEAHEAIKIELGE